MPYRPSALARLLADGLLRRAVSVALMRRQEERLVPIPVPVYRRLTGPPRAVQLPGPKSTRNSGNSR